MILFMHMKDAEDYETRGRGPCDSASAVGTMVDAHSVNRADEVGRQSYGVCGRPSTGRSRRSDEMPQPALRTMHAC